jgi:alanine racemase
LNTLHLYLAHLDHNFDVIRNQLKTSTQIIGVVKANAYGSLAIPFAKRLVELGVDKLAVAYTEEGALLRENGIKTPIMVFYPQQQAIPNLIAADLEPCIYSKELLENVELYLNKNGIKNYPIHIKYNTGLNRVGFPLDQVDFVIQKTKQSCFRLESVYSHLAATEDDRPSKICDLQIERFNNIKAQHIAASEKPPQFHLLNSSGVFNYPECQMDAVRCGIALHGYANKTAWDALLKPVAALESIISQIHQVEKGEAVGYDNGWIAPKKVRIATLPLGHADGIGRHFGHHKAWVTVNGQQAPIVGNICMDMLMVDVSGIPCTTGDRVRFFDQTQTAAALAEKANTNSYELLTGLGPRIKRQLHY